HRGGQVDAHVRRAGEARVVLALPVPVPADHRVVVGQVGLVAGVFEFVRGVLVECRVVGAGGGIAGGVAVGRLAGGIRVDAFETAVQTSHRAALVAQQFLAEAAGIDAQVRLLDIGGRQAGVLAELAGDAVGLGRRDRIPLGQRQGVVGAGEVAHGIEEAGDVGGFVRPALVRHLVVIPGDRGLGGQVHDVGVVDAGAGPHIE